MLSDIHCPYCDKIQKQKPVKSWSYGKIIKKRLKGELNGEHRLNVHVIPVNVESYSIFT